MLESRNNAASMARVRPDPRAAVMLLMLDGGLDGGQSHTSPTAALERLGGQRSAAKQQLLLAVLCDAQLGDKVCFCW